MKIVLFKGFQSENIYFLLKALNCTQEDLSLGKLRGTLDSAVCDKTGKWRLRKAFLQHLTLLGCPPQQGLITSLRSILLFPSPTFLSQVLESIVEKRNVEFSKLHINNALGEMPASMK